MQSQVEYWKSRLKGAPEIIKLPLDFPRPDQISNNFKSETESLPLDFWQQLKAASNLQKISVYQFALAAFSVFLHLWTDENDFCVGSSIDLRKSRGLKDLMGPAINDFIIRCQIDPKKKFSEYSKDIAQQAIQTYQNTDVFYERLAKALCLERHADYNSLYQVVFSIYLQDPLVNTSKVNFERIFADAGSGEVDLAGRINEQRDKVDIILRYNADLFSSKKIKRMLKSYVELLPFLIANPDVSIGKVMELKRPNTLVKVDGSGYKPDNPVNQSSVFCQPLGEIETLIVNVWKEVLNIGQVDLNLSYFKLGGDLMGLVQMRRLLLAQEIDVSLKDLYFCSTVAKLAELVKRNHILKKDTAC